MAVEPSTAEILKKVRQIEIRTRRMVTESLTGAYHSSFRGQGMDFEEVREYVPGDDVRAIDWNVTAKMDRPFIKKFREERELTMMIVLDLSGSGDFGSSDQTKRERAAEIASVLSFSATRNNDKVGLLIYTDQVELIVPPKKGRQHVLRIIRECLYFEPKNHGTRTDLALKRLQRILHRKAIVCLISDFLDLWEETVDGKENPVASQIALVNQRHDLICINISDPREMMLPDVGWIRLEDAETGEIMEVNTSDATVREAFLRNNRDRIDLVEKTFRKVGVDGVTVDTAEPYVASLQAIFNRRGARV
ncbi:MAG: DUF58 domain-containing protein [Opitutales bacterium]|nr:DUF58 domain-containing protein [Opitutales bacterium]